MIKEAASPRCYSGATREGSACLREYSQEEPPRRSHGRSERSMKRPAEYEERLQYNGQPQYEPEYNEPYHNYNTLSNADLARQCFMPAAMARYRNRQWY